MIRFSPNLKTLRGIPHYFHSMLLYFLAKIWQFGVYTFFLTFSAAEVNQTEIIQVIAGPYREILTYELVNAMDWSTKVNYLKENQLLQEGKLVMYSNNYG